jgi:hypothetical protein
LVTFVKNIYEKYKRPVTWKMLSSDENSPTFESYKRFFKKHGWKELCDKYKISYEKSKCNGTKPAKLFRLGEEKYIHGDLAKIISYNNANDIIVEFQDNSKFQIKTSYRYWEKSWVKNPYNKNIFNKACVGNTVTKINDIKKESYKVWYAMLQRCYSECYTKKPTYVQCNVCEDWLCYENFEKWYDKNFYGISNEQMMLDKDILIKHNTLYSPETCVFVPQSINKLFTKRQLHRGRYKIDVTKDDRYGGYKANCNINGERKYLGTFKTENEAYLAYKKVKEENIKNMADTYKEFIPKNLYDAMYRYEVEEDD